MILVILVVTNKKKDVEIQNIKKEDTEEREKFQILTTITTMILYPNLHN